MRVELDEQQWNQLLAILAQAPWNVANPLIMEIGGQLRGQQVGDPAHPPSYRPGEAGTGARRPNGPLGASED